MITDFGRHDFGLSAWLQFCSLWAASVNYEASAMLFRLRHWFRRLPWVFRCGEFRGRDQISLSLSIFLVIVLFGMSWAELMQTAIGWISVTQPFELRFG